MLLGSRYVYSGKYLPNIKTFFEDRLQLSLDKMQNFKPEMKIAAPVLNHEFLKELGDD
jgi:hypothetical protein